MNRSSIGDECNEILPPDEQSKSDRGRWLGSREPSRRGVVPTNVAGHWLTLAGHYQLPSPYGCRISTCAPSATVIRIDGPAKGL